MPAGHLSSAEPTFATVVEVVVARSTGSSGNTDDRSPPPEADVDVFDGVDTAEVDTTGAIATVSATR